MWDGQVAALIGRFRVVRYDLLGHGESAKPRGAFEMAHFVAQLDDLLDGLALGRCALVGFSLGGMIARAYTIARPERVNALVVLNSPHDRTEAERATVRARAEQAATDGPGATADAALERWFTAGFAAACPEVLERVRRAILANDPEGLPASLPRPGRGRRGVGRAHRRNPLSHPGGCLRGRPRQLARHGAGNGGIHPRSKARDRSGACATWG